MKRRKDFVKRRSVKFFRRFGFRVFQSRIFFLVSFAVKTKNGGIRSYLNRMSPLIRVDRLNCNALLLLVQEAELQFAVG